MLDRLRSFSFADVNRVALGLISLVLIFAVTAFAFAIGALDLLESRYEMSAVMTDSGGLRSGDHVRMAGIEIGTVTAVEADFDQGVVVVTFEVDDGAELGPETTAEVSLATLLGGRYLRLAGPVVEPYMADLDLEERRIPIERTRLPLGVQQALGQATRTIDQVNADTLDDVLGQFADIAGDNADSFEPLLTDATALTEALNSRREAIDNLLDGTSSLTSTLADKDEALVALIDQAGSLLATVEQRRDQLETFLGEGSEAAAQLDLLIRTNRDDLDAILADLDDTSAVLDERLPELNQTLAFLNPALVGLDNTTSTGPWVDVLMTGLSAVQIADLLGGSR